MRVFKALWGNRPSSKSPNSRSLICRWIGHGNGTLYVNLKAEVNDKAGIRNFLLSKAEPVKTGAPNRSCQNIKVWKDPKKNNNNQLHIVIIITKIRSLHLQHSSVVRENVILYNLTNQKATLKPMFSQRSSGVTFEAETSTNSSVNNRPVTYHWAWCALVYWLLDW